MQNYRSRAKFIAVRSAALQILLNNTNYGAREGGAGAGHHRGRAHAPAHEQPGGGSMYYLVLLNVRVCGCGGLGVVGSDPLVVTL